MIMGIGTDIVEIARIGKAIERQGDAFAERILTPAELDIYTKHHQPAAYLAKRFAAKEALSKAMGTGIAKGIGFQQIETFNEDSGQPKIVLQGKAKEIQEQRGITSIHLSLSDEQQYAAAFVVLESNT